MNCPGDTAPRGYEDSGDSALSLYDILSWRRQLVKELPRLQIHPYAKKTI